MCVLSASCARPQEQLSWSFGFASAALRTRAVVVEAEIRRGGCQGEAVFSTRASRDEGAASPGSLEPGRYGFFGRAQDSYCIWFAQGCVEVQLPTSSAIRVTLSEAREPQQDPACLTTDVSSARGDDGSEVGDAATGAGDFGGDGMARDASVPNADATVPVTPDATAEPIVDAGGGFDDTSLCNALDERVVACYDFNGDLRDASPLANHASASNPLFEPSPLGRALRPNGQRVFVEDAGSLNLRTLTIEMWIRPDSLINLSGDVRETTLVVDKDQQYGAGFNPSGSPFMQVYRAEDDLESTTASDQDLAVGQWVYLAFSYDGSTASIYRDGALVDEEIIGADVFAGTAAAMHIGSGSPNTTRPFNGLIDALRISNVARSDDDICRAAGKQLQGSSCK